jgi:hypothetical protein
MAFSFLADTRMFLLDNNCQHLSSIHSRLHNLRTL